MHIDFRFLEKEEIPTILPLLSKVNDYTNKEILEERIIGMANHANYRCIGIFLEDTMIGICGLWHMTRHYSGKSLEPDHIYVESHLQGQGIGKKLFDFLEDYAKENGYQCLELNTYTGNTKSHKFYYNLGFKILGFHFVKKFNPGRLHL